MKFYKLDQTTGAIVGAAENDPNRIMTQAEIQEALANRLFAGALVGLGMSLILQKLLQKAKGR